MILRTPHVSISILQVHIYFNGHVMEAFCFLIFLSQKIFCAFKKKKMMISSRLCSALMRCYGTWFAFLLLFSLHVACASEETTETAAEEEEAEPASAVLFPWFSEALGILTVYFLTRYCHALPFTAVMFVMGTLMGVGVVKHDMNADTLQESIIQWAGIDGELLLLVFLPGLLFRDAFSVNFHLFRVSFWQLLIMAFPMVLAGTVLTALVGFYVFPYDWSWNLAMTFGSVLAATDPVAVSALLNEVGAPPRLKMHVSGESMLNDGSAVVFYTIFGASFLWELGIGLGEDINVGEGFKIFFRMSLGGAAIGFAFGLGLILLLFLLHRRLDTEENVLQVASSITIAYLSFFVAEILCHTSGVIAVVFCGITTQAFGSNMINDERMMESFWILVEYLLNTLLFTLGGVVWGVVVADNDKREGFSAKDWGYLILLYVLVQAIRFFLVFSFYPLLSRIGLKSNWREAIFLSFGGLRGAVGIALALALDSEVWHATTEQDESTRALTSKFFGMVGGIALFTLVINGSLSGPLLRKLGLVKSTDIRKRVIEHYGQTTRQHMLDDFIYLMTDPRFSTVDYAVVAYHVPILRGLSKEELKVAVKRNKEKVPPNEYKEPFLDNVLPYICQGQSTNEKSEGGDETSSKTEEDSVMEGVEQAAEASGEEDGPRMRKLSPVMGIASVDLGGTSARAIELRGIFIEILRYAYKKQVEKGELDGRGFLDYVLFQSLEFAADEVSMGKPLNDWEAATIVGANWTNRVENSIHNLYSLNCAFHADVRAVSNEYIRVRVDVKRALAFIAAHQYAQDRFKREFTESSVGEFSADEILILSESEYQVSKAEKVLHSYDRRDVQVIVSHLACRVLLNKGARHMAYLGREGLLTPREACSYVESCDHAIDQLKYCSKWKHPGELTKEEKAKMMALPAFCSARRHLHPTIDNEDKEQVDKEEKLTQDVDKSESS